MSASKVLQLFHPQLVEMLPMNDVTFLSKLFSVNLLPGNIKDQVKSMNTRADKAIHLLDHVILPSVATGVGRCFDDLIKAMKDSEYDGVKELAKLIRTRLRKFEVNSETDTYSTTSKCKCSTVKYSPLVVRRLQASTHNRPHNRIVIVMLTPLVVVMVMINL
ncbi:uncharacterized protein [Dysidea avara]|uniref:uncharacterized protein isoform X2 n=1 Tax=Dysidea avara TaxID=196820 RepID=UPI0033275E0C